MTALIIIAVIIIVFFYIISIYNRLVRLKAHYENGFAQIEVQLKRRYDLIPNLVEVAKSFMEHERETLEAVIAARNTAASSLNEASKQPGDKQATNALAGAESMLSSALGKFNVVVEAYPDLKANQNMMQLSEELTSTENKVSFARQAYNDFVTAYNEYRSSFPPVFFAASFGHKSDAQLLEFADSEAIQAAPKVAF